MSISSYLVLRRRAKSWPESSPSEEPPWRRWYAPWLAAAFALICLMAGTLVTIQILTATSESPRSQVPLGHQGQVENDVADVEPISRER